MKFVSVIRSGMAFALVFALAGCLGAIGSDGYYEPEKPEVTGDPDTRGQLLKRLMTGAGLEDPNKPQIKYDARAPLVPPKDENLLPEPQIKLTKRDKPTEDWPNDLDLLAELNAEERARYEEATNLRNSVTGRERDLLTSKEVRAGARPNGIFGKKPGSYDPSKEFDDHRVRLTPTEMRQGHKKSRTKYENFNRGADNLPTRTSLIDPPDEYRKPSDKAAYDEENTTKAEDENRKKIIGLDRDSILDRTGGRLEE